MNQKITINDVARLAGVSKRTVSRVLNKSPKVGKATREKVQQIIEELDYHPDVQARGLAARRSYMLGMIYDNPDALYIDAVLRGVLSVCRESGYELVIHPCDDLASGAAANLLHQILDVDVGILGDKAGAHSHADVDEPHGDVDVDLAFTGCRVGDADAEPACTRPT